ncbi:MAG: guanylate kinase [Anaerolineae bacterium]
MKGKLPRLLFILSGPSGVGKNTIIKKLLANHPDSVARVRTYTTRERREGEVEGDQYYFVSHDEFRRLAREGHLMEADADTVGHDVYGLGDLYSMPADPFEGVPEDTHLVIAEVDIHGMRRLKERYPQAIAIFVTAPPSVLVERIHGRLDDKMDADSLPQRMETAREQIQAASEFDYVIVNREGHLAEAVEAVERIIEVERMRVREGVDLLSIMPDDEFNAAINS